MFQKHTIPNFMNKDSAGGVHTGQAGINREGPLLFVFLLLRIVVRFKKLVCWTVFILIQTWTDITYLIVALVQSAKQTIVNFIHLLFNLFFNFNSKAIHRASETRNYFCISLNEFMLNRVLMSHSSFYFIFCFFLVAYGDSPHYQITAWTNTKTN